MPLLLVGRHVYVNRWPTSSSWRTVLARDWNLLILSIIPRYPAIEHDLPLEVSALTFEWTEPTASLVFISMQAVEMDMPLKILE
jgi:hypothetical protein